MEVKSHTSVLYPTFHDNYHSEKKSQKEIDIDTSIYQLLSLYLTKDESISHSALTNSLATSTRLNHTKSCHWKNTYSQSKSQRSWLGEERQKSEQELILERNTLQNTSIRDYAHEASYTKKARSKSVSFNDMVTVIRSQGNITSKSLGKEIEEEEFVDALEYLE